MASLIVILSVVLASLQLIGAAHYPRQRGKQVPQHPTPYRRSPQQNPFNQRQIQQYQVAVQYPQGSRVPHGSSVPPGPAAPGHIWIQVPVSSAGPPAPAPERPNDYPRPPAGWAPQPGNQPLRPPPGTFSEEVSYPEQQPGVGGFDGNPSEGAPPVVGGGQGGDYNEVVEEITGPVGPAPVDPAPEYPAPEYPAPEYPAPVDPAPEYPAPEYPAPEEGAWQPGTGGGGEVDPLFARCREARGQFPSATACNKFVNCWDDMVVEQQCPGNLVFSDKGYCDYPDNVDCGDRVAEKPGIGDSAECPTAYGFYRSTVSCGLFYVCDNRRAIQFACPDGLNFNAELNVCDYPYNVDCGDTPPERPLPEVVPATEEPGEVDPAPEAPEQPAVAPEQPATDTRKKFHGGLKRIPASAIDARVPCRTNSVFRLNPACTSVSLCRRGYSTTINCSPGTAWDSKAQACINVYKARC